MTGQPPSSEFWISDDLPSAQSSPVVAPGPDGFAVAWIDSREGRPRVYGQFLEMDGSRTGGNHALLSVEPSDPVYDLDLELDPLGGYWLTYAAGASVSQRLWIVHLGSNLTADRAPLEVAPGEAGERAMPRIGTGPDGRVEVVWVGAGTAGYTSVRHQAFDKDGIALGPAMAVDATMTGASAAPAVCLVGDRSFVTWEAKLDGNWSIFLRGFVNGSVPSTGTVRVDQDALGADQLDPSVGADPSGRLVVIWTDARSVSNGTDIIGRVFPFGTTHVTEEPPEPVPTPEPVPPPVSLRVGPAAPNPFSDRVGILLEVPSVARSVRVSVFDASGRRVAVLHDGPLPAERSILRWSGADFRSRALASGVYWIVAESGGERHALRVVHLR